MPAQIQDLDLPPGARPTDRELTELVSLALNRPVGVDRWSVEPVPYQAGSPATGALLRVRGTSTDAGDWSLFLKVLQHPRHWAGLDRIPPPFRDDFVSSFPWRSELAAWEPGFLAALPAGLRVPRLYRLVELPDDRVALWMEDVAVGDEPWSPERFALAASLLGAFAAGRQDGDLLDACPVPAGYGLRRYADGPVTGGLMMLRDDEVWGSPALAGPLGQRVRAELRDLAPHIPAILDLLDELPQSLPHGDASPQNLLVPRDEPNTLVAIDIAFQCPMAIGSDLAQLLVGLVHAGEMPAADLPDVHAVLAPSFTDGFCERGGSIGLDQVRWAEIGNLVVRSAFTALPVGDGDELPDADVERRLELIAFLLGLSRQLPV